MPSTILVVDDHEIIREMLARLLRKQGHHARKASSGREALHLLSQHAFDLVLLDIMMPEMDGITVLEQLRQHPIWRHIPVVVISGDNDMEHVVRCIELGADDYLFKPFNEVLLRARVAASLERKRLRDKEHSYLEQRLRTLSADTTAEPPERAEPLVDATLLAALDALEQAQNERRRGEDQLRILNTLLEERVAERSAAVERGAMELHRQTIVLQSILDSIGDGIVVIDRRRQLLLANPVARRILGTLLDVDNQTAALEVVFLLADGVTPCPPEDMPLQRALRGQESDGVELLLPAGALADERWLSVTARPLRDRDEEITGAVAVFRDVTTQRQAAEALRASEERYALAAQAANDGLWDWDMRSGLIYYSARWKASLGYSDAEIGSSLDEWFKRVHPDDREALEVRLAAHLKRLISSFEHEYRILHHDGVYRWMSCRGLAVWDQTGRATRLVGSQTDITERKLAEQRLLYDAMHDHLTGLANRARFMDRLSHAIARARRSKNPLFAVLFLDLDRFKLVNDSLGHLAGDQLLVGIAHRLERCLRPGDTLARLGGDEFTILLEELSGPTSVIIVAERILRLLEEPFFLSGQDVFSSASIGIALSSGADYQWPADVLRDADTAMYHAKTEGKSRYAIFDPTMHDRARTRLQIETDLRRGLERDEFFVVYQPIVALGTEKIVGFEALIRWRHPQHGVIMPSDFIAIAEETSLIMPLGQFVLREACRQLQQWQMRYPDQSLSINVNLSARQIADPQLVEQTSAVLRDFSIVPGNLRLEITETAIIEHGDTANQVLLRLRELGAHICIDDFGTGYSSLSYLHRFPIATIKIDRSFVSQMNISSENTEIVRTIVSLARSLGMAAIAEGTETLEQLTQLRALSCEYGQGWLFAEALEADDASALLERHIGGDTRASAR